MPSTPPENYASTSHAADPSSLRLLDSLVNITQQRDFEALEMALISTIAREEHVQEVSIFAPEETREGTRLLEKCTLKITENELLGRQFEWSEASRFSSRTTLIDECYSNKAHIQAREDEGQARLAYVLLKGDEAVGVLNVVTLNPSDQLQHLIDGITKLYSNYVNILDESERDTLTGLLNRKTFDKKVNHLMRSQTRKNQSISNLLDKNECRSAIREGARAWLALFDIDHFKKINDSLGHICGDEVILTVSQLMRKCFRRSDLMFRYGGEEFVIILSPTEEKNAVNVLERFRQTIEAHRFPQDSKVTISIGCAEMDESIFPRTILEQADKALYYAKQNGRNACHFYHQLIENNLLSGNSENQNDIDLF